MKKFSVISTLSLLALLAGCGCCNTKRTCAPECQDRCAQEQCAPECKDSCKEEVCEVAHVAPQQQRVSGPVTDNVKWDKEDLA